MLRVAFQGWGRAFSLGTRRADERLLDALDMLALRPRWAPWVDVSASVDEAGEEMYSIVDLHIEVRCENEGAVICSAVLSTGAPAERFCKKLTRLLSP